MVGETKITLPTIHLNGSSADTLLEGYEKALDKLREAILELGATYPNARDYYVQGDDVFRKARSEHDARTRRLTSVAEELNTLLEHVVEQKNLKEASRARR